MQSRTNIDADGKMIQLLLAIKASLHRRVHDLMDAARGPQDGDQEQQLLYLVLTRGIGTVSQASLALGIGNCRLHSARSALMERGLLRYVPNTEHFNPDLRPFEAVL